MSDFLERHPLPGVTLELERLRKAAQDQLGPWSEGEEIERASLLRRQIARRCIYGVDINHVAVDLARVSLWIHTFVEGLPLSFLDRTLVHGDSLFGAANAEEARSLLSPDGDNGQGDIFSDIARRQVDAVREDIDRLAQSSDATDAEIQGAREAYEHVRAKLLPLREALDIAVAFTVDADLRGQWTVHVDRLLRDDGYRRRMLQKAEPKLLKPRSIHFPLEFPEVFYREGAGFDCIIGNPPWEEATLEEDNFYGRYVQRLQRAPQDEKKRILAEIREQRPELSERFSQEAKQVERVRRFLTAGRFPGMGTGDADLYKAFAWRFLAVVSSRGGCIGVVMPRGLVQAQGSRDFRQATFTGEWDIRLTSLENRNKWLFPVHGQKAVVLCVLIARDDDGGQLWTEGPFTSLAEFLKGGAPVHMPADRVQSWHPDVSIPLLPTTESAEIFDRMMRHPRFGDADRADFEVRPVRELDATLDKVDRNPARGVIVISDRRPPGDIPVVGGEAFDIWSWDPDSYYGWAEPEKAEKILFEKRKRQVRHRASAFFGLPIEIVRDPKTLPHYSPRIAFRDVTKNSNTRTMVVGVVPEDTLLTNKAPYLYFRRGSPTEQAYLLGVLASRPFDWTTRRYVEINMNFFLLNDLPVPLMTGRSGERVSEIALSLSCQQEELRTWAETYGRKPKALTADEVSDLEAELDAVVCHLYGLEERAVVHMMETFHEGWDYGPHLQVVLEHYRGYAREHASVPAES